MHPNTHAETERPCWGELAFWEKGSGPKHPDDANCLGALAGLYYEQGRYAEAERLYALALAIREKALARISHEGIKKSRKEGSGKPFS